MTMSSKGVLKGVVHFVPRSLTVWLLEVLSHSELIVLPS